MPDPPPPPLGYATEPLGKHHNRAAFTCGAESLDRYLQRQASQDARRQVAQVFVHCAGSAPDVLGYYTLSMTSVELAGLPEVLSRQLPRYPAVPAALLGRLAIHTNQQGQGLGKRLLYDAMRRVYEASRDVAAYGLVVDALDASAAEFYRAFGFTALTTDESRLILPLTTIERMFPWLQR